MSGIRILTFVGHSHSGKTASIEAVIQYCEAQGMIPLVAKKMDHPVEWDVPGKNTWRYAQAGARVIVGVDPHQTTIFLHDPLDIPAFLQQIAIFYQYPRPVILLEGWRNLDFPQILCAVSVQDVTAQINPRTVAIAGVVSTDKESSTRIEQEFGVPVIDVSRMPDRVLQSDRYSGWVSPSSTRGDSSPH